jgi:hypothetical protein
LLRKDPRHSTPIFTGELRAPGDLPYVWPGDRAVARR